jgi:pimeloyl-ACP methyl ester carboxylesterase
VLATLVAAALLVVGEASASALNLTGTWHAVYHCEAGWCVGGDFPAVDVLTQEEGSSVVTGGNGTETIHGTLSGNSFSYESETGGYHASGTLTISANGLKWVGPVSDNNGTSGTYEAERASTMATVSGKVVDTSNKPAPGVTISLAGTDDEMKAVSTSMHTGSGGEYSFEVPAGNYSVKASGDMTEQNGGTLKATNCNDSTVSAGEPIATPASVTPGTVSGATCTLPHVSAGETAGAGFEYIYCSASDRMPNDKPPTHCPIVFIPGFLGSRLVCTESNGATGEVWTNIPNPDFKDMRLAPNGEDNSTDGSCATTTTPPGGEAGIVMEAGGSDVYGGVVAWLNKIAPGRAFFYPYDFRKSPLKALEGLNATIDGALSKTGAKRVVLMGHSMGGLVTEAYVANAGYAEKVSRAITLGTPYWGAVKSLVALLTGKFDEVSTEVVGINLFTNVRSFRLSNRNYLQEAARNWQGLFFLYPSEAYGPWLSLISPYVSPAPVGGTNVGPIVSQFGGNPKLLDTAMAAHRTLDSLTTNGVQYKALVGTGVTTMTGIAINPGTLYDEVTVDFGSGDGTVPALSASEGAFAGGGDGKLPVSWECGVRHMPLPEDAKVQGRIENYLFKGEEVAGPEQKCETITGAQVEVFRWPALIAAGSSAAQGSARIASRKGLIGLDQAAKEGLIEVIENGPQTIIVTTTSHPVTVQLRGSGVTARVRTLSGSGSGKSLKQVTGSARYFGPAHGTLSISDTGAVRRNGKPLKASRRPAAPRTKVAVSRRGRFYIVRFSAHGAAGPLATWIRIGKANPKVYLHPLKLTRAQLRKLTYQTVDSLGVSNRERHVKVS